MFNVNTAKLFLLISLSLLVSLSTVYAGGSTPEPQRLMEETSKKMIQEFINNSDAIRNDPKLAYKLINDNLVPKINFRLMSRWVLGKNWKKASKEQQQKFIEQFTTLVIKFYSKALIDFIKNNDIDENIITFIPFRGELKGKYATIHSQVKPPNGSEPVKVNYDLYHSKKTGLWQVYDVSVEGISLVTTYRSSFNQIITQKGMDALLSELSDKTSSINQAKG